MTYDVVGNLETFASPATEYADLSEGELITDNDLAGRLVTQPRVTTMTHDDPIHSNHITDLVDPRGATPFGYVHDAAGRVVTAIINGSQQQFIYGPTANPVPLPSRICPAGGGALSASSVARGLSPARRCSHAIVT